MGTSENYREKFFELSLFYLKNSQMDLTGK